jgi:REP element-mobilizing transposase RayT
LRTEFAGAIHHVTQRGIRGLPIFLDDDDRAFFVWQFEVTAERYGWNVLSYSLLTNHFHLLIETPEPTLAAGMQRFMSMYAQRFNRRHGFEGHVFQGRYTNKIVNGDPYFTQALRYIGLNAFKAKLCARPEDWRWSSHRDLLTLTPGADHLCARVLELLVPPPGPGNAYARLFDGLVPPAAELADHAEATLGLRDAHLSQRLRQ